MVWRKPHSEQTGWREGETPVVYPTTISARFSSIRLFKSAPIPIGNFYFLMPASKIDIGPIYDLVFLRPPLLPFPCYTLRNTCHVTVLLALTWHIRILDRCIIEIFILPLAVHNQGWVRSPPIRPLPRLDPIAKPILGRHACYLSGVLSVARNIRFVIIGRLAAIMLQHPWCSSLTNKCVAPPVLRPYETYSSA